MTPLASLKGRSGWQPLGAWWMVIVLMIFNMIAMVDRYILAMLVVDIQRDLALSDFEISLILGPAFAVCSIVAILPFSWLADRYSRRATIFWGMIAWSLACTASAFAQSFKGLFVTRALVAIGEASLSPTTAPLVADRFPKKSMSSALAVVGIGSKFGMSAAFAIGALALSYSANVGAVHLPLFGELSSWRLALFIVGLPGILFAFLVLTFAEPSRAIRENPAEKPSRLSDFYKQNRKLLLLVIGGFSMMGLCSGSIQNWVPTYITRAYGISAAEYGGPMSLISAIAAVCILFKGFAIDFMYSKGVRDAPVRFFTWCQIIGMPLLFFAFSGISVESFYIVYGLLNVATLYLTLSLSSSIQMIAPVHLRARLMGVTMFIMGFVVQALAPPLVGFLTDFVFRDPDKIGMSILAVTSISLAGSLVLLRLSLSELSRYMEKE